MKTSTKVLLTSLALGASYMAYKTFSGRMVSKKGLEFLKAVEGFKNKAYKDVKGLWTIGVGHLINLTKEPGLLKATLTNREVQKLLDKDLDRFEKVVRDSIKVPLKNWQKDALVSLAFNIGDTGFKNSTLVKRINAGDSEANIIKAFSMWDSPIVLASRRAKEARLYFTGNYSNTLPPTDFQKYYKI
jgi:lysozyme